MCPFWGGDLQESLDVQEAATIVPMDKLLVETDAPYLAPMPYRGKRNEPGYTRYVVEKLRNCGIYQWKKSRSKQQRMRIVYSGSMPMTKEKIEEIIVVEGKDDTKRLKEVLMLIRSKHEDQPSTNRS